MEVPELFYSSYEELRFPTQKSNPSPSDKLFFSLLSAIGYISLFLSWSERLWKRTKVIWRTINIRLVFSSKKPPLFKEVFKRLYCLRNTRTQWEHLQFVLEQEIWSSCFLLSIGCVPLQGMTCTTVAAEIPALCPSSLHGWLSFSSGCSWCLAVYSPAFCFRNSLAIHAARPGGLLRQQPC